ncbi:kinase-like domain-containing protein [Gigaspora rosea]|uniref:Kinase-like domain-containing protein n=1 Tax=Gigaspora rosea TaxID=44941 RepID=A0A397VJ84_9GLOM|nr:kinase-like domain-containing protein [Gigaspora rosea]
MRVGWCPSCEGANYKENFNRWTSGDSKIDELILQTQSNPSFPDRILEWIDYQEFSVYELIGKGGFGEVFSAEWHNGPRDLYDIETNKWIRRGPTKVALKILKNSKNIQDFLNELKNIVEINSLLFVAKTFGISKDPEQNKYVIVMEMYSLGDLQNFLCKKRNMRFLERATIVGWLAAGILRLHENDLIHCDLHSRNVLIKYFENTNNPNYYGPKNLGLIADFGLCKLANGTSTEVIGVERYIAPEVINGGPYTKESDICSYGRIVQDVFANNPSNLINVLISDCLSINPSNRPDIKKNYVFLKEVVVFYELGPDMFFNIFNQEFDKLKSVKRELNDHTYNYDNIKKRLIQSIDNLITTFPIDKGELIFSCNALNSAFKETVNLPIDRIHSMLDLVIENLDIYLYWYGKIKTYKAIDPDENNHSELSDSAVLRQLLSNSISDKNCIIFMDLPTESLQN